MSKNEHGANLPAALAILWFASCGGGRRVSVAGTVRVRHGIPSGREGALRRLRGGMGGRVLADGR